MDEALKEFFGIHTIIFATVCWIGTFFIRRVVEMIWPSLRKVADESADVATYKTAMAGWWNKVILYAVAPLIGVLMALFSTISLPEGLQSVGNRIRFGLTVGFLCGYLFKVLMAVLKRVFGVKDGEVPSGSVPPPAG